MNRRLHSLALATAVVMLACAPGAEALTLKDKLTKSSTAIHTPRPGAKTTNRWCFWKQNNGTAFGKSGFCDAAMDAPVGSPCACHGGGPPGGRQPFTFAGTVIEAPPGGGSAPVIH